MASSSRQRYVGFVLEALRPPLRRRRPLPRAVCRLNVTAVVTPATAWSMFTDVVAGSIAVAVVA